MLGLGGAYDRLAARRTDPGELNLKLAYGRLWTLCRKLATEGRCCGVKECACRTIEQDEGGYREGWTEAVATAAAQECEWRGPRARGVVRESVGSWGEGMLPAPRSRGTQSLGGRYCRCGT